MKKLNIGILAHVDAGKTTLSEAILYLSGKIGKLGRVDNQNAYLDTYALEKSRGITIFSKQAVFERAGVQVTLLDTPGHTDFSAEAERTLQVLDYAILVISGMDGIQEHTKTLWDLLQIYHVPVFVFINKMDQQGVDKKRLEKQLKQHLSENCVSFEDTHSQLFYEQLSYCDETIMEQYLATNQVELKAMQKAIQSRKIYPCFFGSALKLEGVDTFVKEMLNYAVPQNYSEKFGAKVYKITRDEQGTRLTHMKITGGQLTVKDVLSVNGQPEKVNQIRLYSGEKYTVLDTAEAGCICAVSGLSQTRPGQGLGVQAESAVPILVPVLSYQIFLPEGCDPRVALPKLRQLEDENPELQIVWEESLQEIHAQLMGEIQIEILHTLFYERFGIEIEFGEGRIVYKETITDVVEGVGHFEPLRHYAEVHLLLEPADKGSGLNFKTACSEDVLGKNWQRLVLTHLQEKSHKGVLTGSSITDMCITLVAGRAHNKHTEGGDFREATYRAVRQGLMQAQSVLLEPYYNFKLTVPEKNVGRAMTDIEKMNGHYTVNQVQNGMTTLVGNAPVSCMRNYQKEVAAYTRGSGKLSYTSGGYLPCHNTMEVLDKIRYDAERDIENPSGSVFCSHGEGYFVPWMDVKNHMHLESCLNQKEKQIERTEPLRTQDFREQWISPEEINKIIDSVAYANAGKKSEWKKGRVTQETPYTVSSAISIKERQAKKYLLVDGYNIIFAWPELKELADTGNMDGARGRLMDILSNYQSLCEREIMLIFDAYRVAGHQEEIFKHHNICVVFTKEVQTADQYIEKFAYQHKKIYNIAVATSDGLQQIITRGAGCILYSARELREDIEAANQALMERYEQLKIDNSRRLGGAISGEASHQLREMIKK